MQEAIGMPVGCPEALQVPLEHSQVGHAHKVLLEDGRALLAPTPLGDSGRGDLRRYWACINHALSNTAAHALAQVKIS